jgi:transposase-like protein
MTARPYCASEHTTRDGKHPQPRRAEYRCRICGKTYCNGCLNMIYEGKNKPLFVCGDEQCMGEVERV